jgi:Protein of unknown function (DUF2783)
MPHTLITHANLTQPDDFYAALLAAHEGLTEQHSHQLNAALALTLANHIGHKDVLHEALKVARASIQCAAE